MTRALLTLLVGVIAAVLLGAWISPAWSWREALLPVLVTGGLGALVLAVAGRRAALRDRAQQLADQMNTREAVRLAPDDMTTDDLTSGESRSDGQEADRG